jgi:hypothetical protein
MPHNGLSGAFLVVTLGCVLRGAKRAQRVRWRAPQGARARALLTSCTTHERASQVRPVWEGTMPKSARGRGQVERWLPAIVTSPLYRIYHKTHVTIAPPAATHCPRWSRRNGFVFDRARPPVATAGLNASLRLSALAGVDQCPNQRALGDRRARQAEFCSALLVLNFSEGRHYRMQAPLKPCPLLGSGHGFGIKRAEPSKTRGVGVGIPGLRRAL